MSDSRDLIRAIMDEDFVSAKELTNSLLFSTVADNIDDVRAEVGQSIYGDIDEKWDTSTVVSPSEKGEHTKKSVAELKKQLSALKSSGPHKKGSPEYGNMKELQFAIRAKTGWGSVEEGKDYDQDGTVEAPKDEVLGSRINAAVKAGKLTPAQAAKTKNKGKYR